MLNIVCPKCQHTMKLAKFKVGRFSPTCKACTTKFQLLIVQKPDQTFAAKTGLFPNKSEPTTKSPATGKSPAKSSGKRPDDLSKTPAVKSSSASKSPPAKKSQPPQKSLTAKSSTASHSPKPDSPTRHDPLDATSAFDSPTEADNLDKTSIHSSSNLDETFDTPVPPSIAQDNALDATNPSIAAASRSGTRGVTRVDGTRSGSLAANRTRLDSQPGATAASPVLGGSMGSYRLLKMLGEGGMGAVYLAKQTSLDRNVALKVIKSELSGRASLMARFTREAYAAAQLVHPNVVQIYDMGDDRGNCYFSMELVPGTSLAELVGKGKRLDPEQAASYILHAARGLECAHNAGMVHRDVKPANLLVNHDGTVKVADLGLVKVPDQEEIEDEDEITQMSALSASQDITRFGSALGTPYYMAPEQAKNAVKVDHRADIYSLGCTFYVLLTGKKPFDGKSFQEVVSKHESDPLILPSKIVSRVPDSLSSIVVKMMAKRPDDRYQTMRGVITDLEDFLGISTTAAFTPDEADADLLEKNAKAFNSVGLSKMRGLLPLALTAGCALIAVVLFFISWRWALGFLVLPVAAIAGYFFISGSKENSNLFSKFRELVFHAGIFSWLKWLIAGLLLLVASFLVGLFFPVLVLGLVGVGLGAAYYFTIDKPIQKQRVASITETEQLLRKMRLKGMDESLVQMFVAKYSGKHWEEYFERLFGYEAKRRVRDEILNSDLGKKRPKFWAWRDRVNDNLDTRLEPLVTEKEKQHLQKVEQAGLQEEGVSLSEAKERAAQMADALVDHGDSLRVEQLQKRLADLDPEAQRLKQRLKVKAMLAEARSGKYKKEQSALQKLSPMLNRVLGSYTRFLLGCLLIVGCLMWARQNNIFEDIKATAAQAQNFNDAADAADGEGGQEKAKELIAEKAKELANRSTEPLKFPLLGAMFFRNFNALIAGLILVCSVIIYGWKMSIFAIPAAMVTLWGETFGLPAIFPISVVHSLSALIGVGIFMIGIVFGRMED